MVKTTGLLATTIEMIAVLALAGCAPQGAATDLRPESLQLAPGTAGSFLSLTVDASSLYAVYADPSTATLNLLTVPLGPHLPPAAPKPDLIDKIDVSQPLAAFFGEHVLCVNQGTVGVLYLDRETDTRNVLKLAWKAPTDTQWNVDAIEPTGDPLSLEPDAGGGFRPVWTSGIVAYRNAGGQSGLPVPPISLRLAGRPGQSGHGAGFTAYDSLASVLLSFQWKGGGLQAEPVPGATPVQASLISADGRLNVLSWEPRGRRLVLRQQKGPDTPFSAQTVTICEGTDTVALLPGTAEGNFLFLFNETVSQGAGRFESRVSLIGPGGLMGFLGARYGKGVVAHGNEPIDGFAAARTDDSLYVIVSQGDLRLLRIPLAR